MTFVKWLLAIEGDYGGLSVFLSCACLVFAMLRRSGTYAIYLIVIAWFLSFIGVISGILGMFGQIATCDVAPTYPPDEWQELLYILIAQLVPTAALTIPTAYLFLKRNPEFRLAEYRLLVVGLLVAVLDIVVLVSSFAAFCSLRPPDFRWLLDR